MHTHTCTHTLSLVLRSLVLHSVFLWGNCWFQTGSIKDETTFALVSLWCREAYLQPALLVTAHIDMRRAQCTVLAGKNHHVFLPRLFPLDKQTHSGLHPQDCVGYVHLIGSQNNSSEEEEFIKFSIQTKQVRAKNSKQDDGRTRIWLNTYIC